MSQFVRTKPVLILQMHSAFSLDQQYNVLEAILAKLKEEGYVQDKVVSGRVDYHGFYVCETCSTRISEKNIEVVCGHCGGPFCNDCHNDHIQRVMQ